jgi:hypothetical protein
MYDTRKLARHLHSIGAAALALAFVTACAPAASARGAALADPHFDPVAFFTGETEGRGRLKVMFSRPKSMRVSGHGMLQGDGVLVLDQTVTTEGDRAKTRQWRIRQTAPDHYVGTLTDASGPVRLDVTGNCLRIHYHAKGGLAFSQVLTLQPGGQISQNVMKVRKLGMVVATIRETITRR